MILIIINTIFYFKNTDYNQQVKLFNVLLNINVNRVFLFCF
ncbi:hypothetical protein ykris0001_2180 [Yersinia kristensenii ATCC 33638]|nr:hypothetical protein ykris0001_2180 [Yersinia kristensenii ATCC 33638]